MGYHDSHRQCISQSIVNFHHRPQTTHFLLILYPMNVYNLRINFEESGKSPVEFPIVEGESVLDVCLDNGIELQHNCGGVCGCSTCQVYVNQGMDNIQEISDKEEDFIDRAVNPRIN